MILSLTTHIYNEELLLPGFISHHAPIFDSVTVIDHASTDSSLDIIREKAPHWRVVPSRLPDFNAALVDVEVMEVEKEYHIPGSWKTALNVTEWVWEPDLRYLLSQYESFDAVGFRTFFLVDKEELPISIPLYQGRTWGFLDDSSVMSSRHWRYFHKQETGQYTIGRHSVNIPHKTNVEGGHLLHFSMSPWPQAIPRKMQIQTKMPEGDKIGGLGIQHIQTLETLNNYRNQLLTKSGNLLLDSNFKRSYDYFTNGGH